jgi:hypothetical protein
MKINQLETSANAGSPAMNNKKAWFAPTVEIIADCSIQSGNAANGTEGVKTVLNTVVGGTFTGVYAS